MSKEVKVQFKHKKPFVALGEGWIVSLHEGWFCQVFYGPTASREDERRRFTGDEIEAVEAAIKVWRPEAKPQRWRR